MPDADSAKTHLGEQQWTWLEEQLRKPAEIRLIASSTQVIPNEKYMDEWGNFPHERQRLFDTIDQVHTGSVILLSGNVHFGELSKRDNGKTTLYELTSSGMTHINETYAAAPNRFRVHGPVIRHNFGLINIDWDSVPTPKASLQVIDEMGTVSFSQTISLGN